MDVMVSSCGKSLLQIYRVLCVFVVWLMGWKIKQAERGWKIKQAESYSPFSHLFFKKHGKFMAVVELTLLILTGIEQSLLNESGEGRSSTRSDEEAEGKRLSFRKDTQATTKCLNNSTKILSGRPSFRDSYQKHTEHPETSYNRSTRSSITNKSYDASTSLRKSEIEHNAAIPALDEVAIQAVISIMNGHIKPNFLGDLHNKSSKSKLRTNCTTKIGQRDLSFALYYKEWLTDGADIPLVPSIQISSISVPCEGSFSNSSHLSSGVGGFSPQPVVIKKLYDEVFRHSHKLGAESKEHQEESYEISVRRPARFASEVIKCIDQDVEAGATIVSISVEYIASKNLDHD
ncbi:hypothetical protein RND71_002561 [Anisodus tanguticus]|uniref:Uncharacterized protein n=1 Tax=Anisodus tanguticus TaxID=243964 RepID=A0AAE1T1D3_9SOLA|nr:hypothetical protein RND71_002561 [Anisodus tanguticus]